MAEGGNDGQERTEEATAKRLSEAREKGDIPRSRELNTTLILMVGSISLLVFGESIGNGLGEIMRRGFLLERKHIFDTGMMLTFFGDILKDAFIVILPIIVLCIVAIFISPMLMGGFNFATKALQPDITKLDPIKGLKKLFSVQGLMELVKSILKVVLVGGIGFLLIWYLFKKILYLGELEFEHAYRASTQMVGWFLLVVCSSIILIAAFDVPFQRWSYKKKLRMTKQEVKEERKNTEGNPEIKGKIRQMQLQAAMRRMMEEVPKADVVITNPTHFAVALKYEEGKMGAPRLVAKGSDLIAARIREIAEENRVPIVSAPPLARAIFFSTELNDEIPSRLYIAVAQILAYVYQLRHAAEYGHDKPEVPRDLDVPEDMWKGRH